MMDTTWIIPFFIYFNTQQAIRPFHQEYSNSRFHIQTMHQGDVGSNFFTGNVLSSFLQGRPIERSRREKLKDRFGISNSGHHLGLEAYNDITFYYKPEKLFGSQSWAIFGGVKNRILTQASFSSRVGEAVMLGNAHLENKVVNLEGFGFNYWQYQQLQVGLIKTIKTEVTLLNFGMGIAYLNGNNWLDFHNREGYFYTSANGDSIELAMRGQFRQSDNENNRLFTLNGYGASVDLFLEGKTKDLQFFVGVQDIGGIAFQRNARTYSFDTLIIFQGLEFESITNIGDSYFQNLSDSLQSIINSGKRSANHFAFLPTMISGGISTELSAKTSAQLFVNHRLGGHYNPQFIFRLQWKALPKFHLGVNGLLGGYHSTGLGADVAANLGSGYVLSTGMRSFLGLISPNSTAGFSGFFSFVKYFGK